MSLVTRSPILQVPKEVPFAELARGVLNVGPPGVMGPHQAAFIRGPNSRSQKNRLPPFTLRRERLLDGSLVYRTQSNSRSPKRGPVAGLARGFDNVGPSSFGDPTQ